MNNPQQIADLIRLQTTSQKISIRKMLKDIGLGVNSLSHMDNGSMPKADNLGKVADYLNCSVDYLLGRTDNINSTTNSYNHNGDNSVQNIGGQTSSTDSVTKEMIERFEILDFSKKLKVMTLIDELVNEKEKK